MIERLKAALAALEAGDLLCELTAAELLRSVIAEMEAGEPVAWFKHGPYEDGEPLMCVFEDPHDEDCFSALVYQGAQPKSEASSGVGGCAMCGAALAERDALIKNFQPMVDESISLRAAAQQALEALKRASLRLDGSCEDDCLHAIDAISAALKGTTP